MPKSLTSQILNIKFNNSQKHYEVKEGNTKAYIYYSLLAQVCVNYQ